jgi:microcystin-dependent protein
MLDIYIYIIVSIVLVLMFVSNTITKKTLEKSNHDKITDTKNSLEKSIQDKIIDTKNILEKSIQDKMVVITYNTLDTNIINKLDTKIDTIDNKINTRIFNTDIKIDTKIDALDSKIVTKIDSIDTKINILDNKINTIDTQINTKINTIDTQINTKINTIDTQINTVINNIKGIIVMWSGNITNIPAGWAFCNGEKYKLNSLGNAIVDNTGTITPDLRSRFIVGASRDNDLSNVTLANGLSNHTVKTTGGAEKVILSKEQMPSHNHDIINILNQGVGCHGTSCLSGPFPGGKVFPLIAKSGEQLIKKNTSDLSFTDNISPYGRPAEIPVDTGFMGGSLPHENMPPYFALAYIMKL